MNDTGKERPRPGSDHERYEMETVFTGPPSEAYVARSALDDLGFLTHIASENIKTIDPFVTGLNPLDVCLQVPRSDAPQAYRALRELKGEKSDDAEHVESAGDYGRDLLLGLEDLSRRTRFASLTVILAPVAAVLGFVYIVRTLPLEKKPAHHVFTLTAIVFAWMMTMALLAAVLQSLL